VVITIPTVIAIFPSSTSEELVIIADIKLYRETVSVTT